MIHMANCPGRLVLVAGVVALLLIAHVTRADGTERDEPHTGTPPNILLIIVDDMGYGDLGCYGSRQIPTPNIDSLGTNGVRFTQAYVTAPVCAPSRAGLITGQYQQRFGFEHNISVPEFVQRDWVGLPREQKTVADHLQQIGYRTGAIGKWHLGATSDDFHPGNRGFDSFFGFLGGSHDYLLRSDTENKLLRDRTPVTGIRTPYLTDWLTMEATDFIEAGATDHDPWFLYLAYNTPHTPMQARAEDIAPFTHLDKRRRQIYCGMQKNLDDNVGRLLSALRETGQLDDTLIVFVNDNGGTPITNSGINAPLRGMKGTFLEGGIRVPMLIQWPAVLPAGSVYQPPVSTLDLLPTFLAAADVGAHVSGPAEGHALAIDGDGVNLLPYLAGERTDRPHDTLYWRIALRGAAIREGDWKLIRTPHRAPMLFNVVEDTSELRDRALDRPALVQKLMHTLHRWEATFDRNPMWISAVHWGSYNEKHYDREYLLTQPEGR